MSGNTGLYLAGAAMILGGLLDHRAPRAEVRPARLGPGG